MAVFATLPTETPFCDSLTVHDQTENTHMSGAASQTPPPPQFDHLAKRNASGDHKDGTLPSDNQDKGHFRDMYFFASIDGVEYVENYRPAGLFPISLGDRLLGGLYIILHKLGYGGSSTIWLARNTSTDSGRLVTLKAMRADAARRDRPDTADLDIPKHLLALYPFTTYFQTPLHHFYEQSVNGEHLIIIYPLAGPNVSSLYALPANHYWSPSKAVGSRRFRTEFAIKVAKDTSMGLRQMHAAGAVHGDLTTSNILVKVAPAVLEWSDAEVNAQFGEPITDEVHLLRGDSHGPHAPPLLYAPIPISNFSDASLLQETTIIHDFGKSYLVASPPADYSPGTMDGYMPPEMFFDRHCDQASDIWMLACLIYEVRTGLPLFDLAWSFRDDDLIVHMAEMLGRLPDRWWSAFKDREQWFHDDGRPRSEEEQERSMDESGRDFITAVAETLHEKLRLTGTHRPSDVDEGPMCERPGVRLEDNEVELLGDLLGKMLKYEPEERITIAEVIEHPWFSYSS